MLINLAASADLFHTATGTAYADLVIDGHRETWPVRSPRFSGWLRRAEARAQFDGPERTVQVRFRRPASSGEKPGPQDPHQAGVAARAKTRSIAFVDEFSVPLCRIHHRLVHRVGNEASWWKEAGIDPVDVARKLWGRTLHAEGRQQAAAPNQPAPSSNEQDRTSQPAAGTSAPT